MPIRIPLAAALLSSLAFAQDKPAERTLQPFASQQRQFTFSKPIRPAKPAASRTPETNNGNVTSERCSIPLTNFARSYDVVPNMPVLQPPADPNVQFTMKLARPPAPPCKDDVARNPQVPDIRP